VRDGASEEMVVAALCHDIGKAISDANHAAISAAILRPYLSHETCEIVRTHQVFQGKYLYALMGKDPETYRKYEAEPWFERARRFSDTWDQTAFDPDYDSLPLSYFEPMIDRVFAAPRWD
jgi:predicted HD phosphohydrolase